jgi:hypothetical protein
MGASWSTLEFCENAENQPHSIVGLTILIEGRALTEITTFVEQSWSSDQPVDEKS